jgi:hypothetical protein
MATLSRLRSQLTELRERIDGYNAEHPVPENHTQVLLYAGQCLIAQGNGEADDCP